jgi:two-component system alkaline phosphatase synthesis response regulator PhoP
MQKQGQRILIVDDEEDLCEILQFNLESEGYETEIAYAAEEALKKDLSRFDLILLDVMMEKMSGFRAAEKIRNELGLKVPIIFITAKNTENDLITGFGLGADDYITKPFSLKELAVRVRAVLRRSAELSSSAEKSLIYEDLELNFKKRTVTIKAQKIELTKKEFEILALLLGNRGMIYSRNDILKKVWEDTTIVTLRTVDVHITRLRKKMIKYGDQIKSKSGYGYTFEN